MAASACCACVIQCPPLASVLRVANTRVVLLRRSHDYVGRCLAEGCKDCTRTHRRLRTAGRDRSHYRMLKAGKYEGGPLQRHVVHDPLGNHDRGCTTTLPLFWLSHIKMPLSI